MEWSLGDVRGPRRHERNHLDSSRPIWNSYSRLRRPCNFYRQHHHWKPQFLIIALTTSDAVGRLDAIHKDLGFAAYTQSFSYKDNTAPLAPLSGHNMFNMFAITFALMVGTAGLPHVIVRFYTTPNVRAARYSAFWAILFIALLYTTAPAVAVFARLNLIDSLHNKPIAEAKKN